MSRFLDTLKSEEVDEFAGIHRVARLRYESDLLGCTIESPDDFLSDFASVPRLPLAYLMFGGKGKRPATIHDLLYHSRAVPRELADQVLREAMIACGYGRATAWTFYQACRVGGQRRWDAPNVEQSAAVEATCALLRARLAHFWKAKAAPSVPENAA